jgi:hypothetical protein
MRFIADILASREEAGLSHAGVIRVNNRTIRQGGYGGLIRALRALVEEHGGEDWRDQVRYLLPA